MQPNIHVTGVTKGKGKQKIFKEIMTKIFQNMVKTIHLQIQGTQLTPSIRDKKNLHQST